MAAATATVRMAVPADLERISWLERSCLPDPWPFDLLAQELAHFASFMLVAVRGGGSPADGYASFRMGGGEAELLRLAVAPEARRGGLARSMVLAGLDRLRVEQVRSCFLEVRPNNPGAIALYESLGFAQAGRRRRYYRDGTDALVYAIRIC